MVNRLLFYGLVGTVFLPRLVFCQDPIVQSEILFGERHRRASLALPDLIEGNQVQVVVRLRNGSPIEYADLRARVTGKCVDTSGIEGKSIEPRGSVDLVLNVLPTNRRLQQEVTILGLPANDAGEDREAVVLMRLGLSARVRPPFQTTGGHLSRGNSDRLETTINLRRHVDDEELLTEKVSFAEDFLKVTAVRTSTSDARNYSVVVSAEPGDGLPAEQFWTTIRLPTINKKTGVERVREERAHFSTESLLEIAPRLVRFTEQDGMFVGRFVVKDYRSLERAESAKHRVFVLRKSGDVFEVVDVTPELEISAIGDSTAASVTRIKLRKDSLGSDRTKLVIAVGPPLPDRDPELKPSPSLGVQEIKKSYVLLETDFPESTDGERNDD